MKNKNLEFWVYLCPIITSVFNLSINLALRASKPLPLNEANIYHEKRSTSLLDGKNEVVKGEYYQVTGYCLNKNLMASGKKVYKGAIACPAFLKFGKKINILGNDYVCEDRMALKYRNGKYIDIWFENCQDAINFGRKTILVNIID